MKHTPAVLKAVLIALTDEAIVGALTNERGARQVTGCGGCDSWG
jgi:hypothetical protein